MPVLVLGLIILLGSHSLHLFAPAWRERQIRRMGKGRWYAISVMLALIGFLVMAFGFHLAAMHSTPLYAPPASLRPINAVLTLIAFVLAASAFVPHNRFRAGLRHPLLIGICCWAFGHLLVNGNAHDLVLFGAFFAWGFANYAVLSIRTDGQEKAPLPVTWRGDVLSVLAGVAGWALFAFWLHALLIGVQPMSWPG
ncbi:NnrU family protein [Oleiagrimonas sp. C23AA]|uniref:NnrU family protein n=1 Tax=Oleiagrimonas sp. C23AA TaxID=2719047 RepID=UPI001423D793|nr:NnrU family protein [Oleiagrimonas sp. C23AA]NII12180.1 NnrU family protein [Oleiagrimonas sp. C23AA]